MTIVYNNQISCEVTDFLYYRKFHGVSKTECLTDIKKGKVEIVVTTFETFREHQVNIPLPLVICRLRLQNNT